MALCLWQYFSPSVYDETRIHQFVLVHQDHLTEWKWPTVSLNTSLSHWYTWPAVSAMTLASSAAWPDGYSLIHQCTRSQPGVGKETALSDGEGLLASSDCTPPSETFIALFLHNHVLLLVGTSALCKSFLKYSSINLATFTFVCLPETVVDVCSHLPLHCSLAGRTVPTGSLELLGPHPGYDICCVAENNFPKVKKSHLELPPNISRVSHD